MPSAHPATTAGEPCFAGGRWKHREVEPLFRVTKLLLRARVWESRVPCL